MSELMDDLVQRLRQIQEEQPETESELRSLSERAHELERALATALARSEARLGEVSADPESSLAETATLLRRVDALGPALQEIRAQLGALERRSRRLRTEWLLRQASTPPR